MSHVEQLAQLRSAILQGADAVERRVACVKNASNDAIAEAVRVGNALSRAKEICGSDFNGWLARNAGRVTLEQASTLMVVAASESDVQSGRGKLDALRALGVVE